MALFLPPAAARAEPAADTALGEVAEGFLGIEQLLTNTRARLRKDIRGLADPGAPQRRDRSPQMQACCGPNFDAMQAWLAHLGRITYNLELYYGEQGNRPALEELAIMKSGLRVVATGVSILGKSPTPQHAERAYQGIIAPFNRAREASRTLAECCAVPAGAFPLERPAAVNPFGMPARRKSEPKPSPAPSQ